MVKTYVLFEWDHVLVAFSHPSVAVFSRESGKSPLCPVVCNYQSAKRLMAECVHFKFPSHLLWFQDDRDRNHMCVHMRVCVKEALHWKHPGWSEQSEMFSCVFTQCSRNKTALLRLGTVKSPVLMWSKFLNHSWTDQRFEVCVYTEVTSAMLTPL